MKVAIVGKFYTEAFGLHIEEALKEMGHEVLRLDPQVNFAALKPLGKRMRQINKTLYQELFGKLPPVRRLKSKSIYKQLRGSKADLTLVLHDFLTREEVQTIKSITKSPVAIWFPDAISNFQKSMFFYADYDFLFFKDRYIVNQLREELRLNVYYLPQCCNPNKHKPAELNKEDRAVYGCDITNAGNIYPSRAALLSQLIKDYKIKIWGNLPAIWLQMPELNSIVMRRNVFNEEKAKAFGAAKVVLNNLHPAEINGLNKRTFEISACGGLQITNYKECTKEHFEIGKEIICYKDFNDLKEKLDYFIDDRNEPERQQIISAGRQRVLKEHTYKHRLQQMFELIFKLN